MEYLTLVKGGEQQVQKVKLPRLHPVHPSIRLVTIMDIHIYHRNPMKYSMPDMLNCPVLYKLEWVWLVANLLYIQSLKNVLLMYSHTLHRSALTVIDHYFIDLLEEQDFLATREQWSKVLALVPKTAAAELDTEWNDNPHQSSKNKWRRLAAEVKVSRSRMWCMIAIT